MGVRKFSWQKIGRQILLRSRRGAEVLLDGERIPGASFIKIEIGTKKVAKVTLELYAEVEVDANFELNEKVQKKPAMKTSDGKYIAVHTISNYSPAAIVKKG